jgi:7-carboxy-7-deazaguanine synthase
MQDALVNELTHFANERGIFITIETEGSHFVETDYRIGLVSLSPKFSNSIPKLDVNTPMGKLVDQKMIDQHNKLRLNKDAMRKMIDYHYDYHYKPVWDGTEAGLNEIENFRVEMDIPKWKTWLMPAGDTRETLVHMYPISIEKCMEMGYNWTGRDHIIAYDTKRAV